MTPTALDIFARVIRFHPDGSMLDDEFRMTDGLEGWQLATFHAETDEDVHADHWEIHHSADELVCCLSGAMRLYLRAQQPDDEEEMVALTSGTGCIVPRGRWHRIELDGPTDLMSVTLPHGSRLERRTA
ncbi:cupin [Streptomyces sp. NPDC049577]|uniref:cupin n=1 Tax=Streptomyces sp. NPDC049577 TaxID=3155153 RepID=UPI0034353CC7